MFCDVRYVNLQLKNIKNTVLSVDLLTLQQQLWVTSTETENYVTVTQSEQLINNLIDFNIQTSTSFEEQLTWTQMQSDQIGSRMVRNRSYRCIASSRCTVFIGYAIVTWRGLNSMIHEKSEPCCMTGTRVPRSWCTSNTATNTDTSHFN